MLPFALAGAGASPYSWAGPGGLAVKQAMNPMQSENILEKSGKIRVGRAMPYCLEETDESSDFRPLPLQSIDRASSWLAAISVTRLPSSVPCCCLRAFGNAHLPSQDTGKVFRACSSPRIV